MNDPWEEIHRYTFLMADLAGHRNGGHCEAGYAEALGIPVKLTCKDSMSAFLILNRRIPWKDQIDLHKGLYERIEATIDLR